MQNKIVIYSTGDERFVSNGNEVSSDITDAKQFDSHDEAKNFVSDEGWPLEDYIFMQIL